MTEIALVHVTFADAAEGERIGAEMVAARLAACVHLGEPVRAIYRWRGKVERAREVPGTFKTAPVRVEALKAAIARHHGYDLPVLEVTRAAVSAEVAAWVAESTR